MSRSLSLLAVGLALVACRSNDRDTTERSSPPPTDWEASTTGVSKEGGYDARTGEQAGVPKYWNDDDFVRKALQGGQFEVESSRLALEKASAGSVKAFATMMVEDHGTANQTLDALARRKRVTLPADMGAMLVEKVEELKKLEGPQFDREYVLCQVKAHDEAIALFERATREARDREIKDFAVRTLPSLRKHRSILQDVEESWTKEEEAPVEEPGG